MGIAKRILGESGGYGAGRQQFVSGDRELLNMLKDVPRSVANRVMRPAVNAGAARGSKILKSNIPGKYKSARKAVGWRAIPVKKNRGVPGAKIGAGVGKRRKKRSGTTKRAYKGRSRPGVGISSSNIHWLYDDNQKHERFHGVKQRKNRSGVLIRRQIPGKKTKSVGIMTPQLGSVGKQMLRAAGRISSAMIKRSRIAFARESKKLEAKRLAKGKAA